MLIEVVDFQTRQLAAIWSDKASRMDPIRVPRPHDDAVREESSTDEVVDFFLRK